MDIVTIMKAVGDFGMLVVIAGIFMYVVIRAINLFFQKFESKISNRSHDALLDMRFDISKEIQSLLEAALDECKGSRIQVIEFSNSVMSVAYLPFKYMTCTYEIYTPDRSASSHRIDHLSTSLFTSFFIDLQNNDYVILDIDNKKVRMCGAMYDILKESGDTRSLCVELSTSKGKSIRDVSLKKSTEFSPEDIEVIHSLANRLSALRSVADK